MEGGGPDLHSSVEVHQRGLNLSDSSEEAPAQPRLQTARHFAEVRLLKGACLPICGAVPVWQRMSTWTCSDHARHNHT